MKFDHIILSNDFKINECDKCFYIKNIPEYVVTVYLYVDNTLIMSTYIVYIIATKRILASKFDMKDLRVANLLLKIKILKTSQRLILSQSHYIQIVLENFKYLDFRIEKISIDVNLALTKIKVKLSLN